MSKKKVVADVMSPEDVVKALVSIRDAFKEIKDATDQLLSALNKLGVLAGMAKDGVIAATENPATKKPAPAQKPAAKPAKKPAPAKQPATKKPAPAKKPATVQTAKQQLLADIARKSEPAPTDDQAGKAPDKKGDDAVRGSSVRMSAHEITLNIGAQPVKELAEQDAKEFLNNHKVFWYRPIQFPDPKRYSIQPRILSAKVVERKNPKFTRAPWTVSTTIEAQGDDKRCEAWLTSVLNKNRSEQE